MVECNEDLRSSSKDVNYLPDKVTYSYKNESLQEDLKNIINGHHPPKMWDGREASVTTPDTISSDFISMLTSTITLATPEPEPTPEPTMEEIMYATVSNVVDKAILFNVNDAALNYDIAHVELHKAVEQAMDVPVLLIREDIIKLFHEAYKGFEMDIIEKAHEAAEKAWINRMRKKLKHTLRLQKNFIGYESPPTPKSIISSHPSYSVPPLKPCQCFPQFQYNRYRKDHFGVYIPNPVKSDHTLTVSPVLSSSALPYTDTMVQFQDHKE